jgi:hypothetical protein
VYYSALRTSFHLCHIKSINSPPSPTVSSPSRSIPRKGPAPNSRQVTRGIQIWLGNTHIGSGHGRKLRVRIIRRGNLNNIGRDDMQAVQASQDGAQLARRPPASLGSACRGRERRVDRIDLHPVKIEIERAERSPHRPAEEARLAIDRAESACSAPANKQITHVDGEINRPVANRLADLLDDPRRTCVRK